MKNLKVSVCIATFNGEKYIKEQIDSILCQLSESDELIISDDSSTDSTIAIIESYNDRRIQIFRNQHFRNPIFNFENALKKASGDFIFLSDQDDVWMPEKVVTMKHYLKKHELVLSDFKLVDMNLKELPNKFKTDRSRILFPVNIIYTPYMGCCMAFHKKLLQKTLPFPNSIPMHDMWIGLISSLYYKPIYIPDKLIMRRIHDENVTQEDGKSSNSLFEKLKIRYRLIKSLLVFLKLQKYGIYKK